MTEAYPLQWPAGWARTKPDARIDSRYRFRTGPRIQGDYSTRPVTFDVARRKLLAELSRLGAKNPVISSNLPLRADGEARADAARYRITDPGIAVYFTLKGRQMVMASDRYDAPSANLRSVGLAIEAMRQLDRHGGGTMMERAFAGFAALPPPGSTRPWRDVLGLGDDIVGPDEIEAAFRTLLKRKHPDAGGSHEAMKELNAARDAALKEIAP